VRQANQGLGKIVNISISTRVPTKYRIFDLETGDVWAPDNEGVIKRSTDHVILTREEVEDWRHAVRDATEVIRAASRFKR
jgi:hypothetical protein